MHLVACSSSKMMSKSLLILAALVAVASAQSFQYSAILDDFGDFIMRWNIREVSSDLEIRFEVKTKGWLSLLIVGADGSYADLWFGGYDDVGAAPYLADYRFNLTSTGGHTLPEEDASQDLVLQGGKFDAGITTVDLKRAWNTGDARDDVIIGPGVYTLGWSFHATSDDPNEPHTNAGFATLTLVP